MADLNDGSPDDQGMLRPTLSALAEQRETIAGIERGLADADAGRVTSREQFEADFRAQHGLPDTR